MIRPVDRDLARTMLQAQGQGYGTIPHNAETAALLQKWESLGWVEGHFDEDGDHVYVLTFAGRDEILGPATGGPPPPSKRSS